MRADRAPTAWPAASCVTGTDTGVGKTVVAAALLRELAAEGYRAVGMKPVAAGHGQSEDPRETRARGHASARRGGQRRGAARGRNPTLSRRGRPAPRGRALRHDDRPRRHGAAGRLAARADALVVEGAGGALVPLVRATTCSTSRAARASGAAGRRHPPRLPQSRAAVRARHTPPRPRARAAGSPIASTADTLAGRERARVHASAWASRQRDFARSTDAAIHASNARERAGFRVRAARSCRRASRAPC